MLKEKKTQIINKFANDLSRSEIIVATNYQGLTAKQMSELRHALVKAGGEYHVIKNTLACIAINKAGKEHMVDMIDGPIALAFSYGDIVNLVKALDQCIKSKELPLKVKGGLLGEKILTPEEVISLANLPSKEVLISQLLTHLQATIIGLRDVLNSPLLRLIAVLQNRQ
jgi:large subunit ribosomal protein L10